MDVYTYFKKNQEKLLQIANSTAGRVLLSTSDGEFLNNLKIFKVTPESIHVDLGDKYRAFFFTVPLVATKLIPLSENVFIPKREKLFRRFYLPQIGLTTSTFNPSSGGDGSIVVVDSTFTAVRNAVSGTPDNRVFVYTTTLGTFDIYRAFFPFNTASLTAAAVVTAWFIKLYRDDSLSNFFNDNNTSAEIIPTTQASGTALAGTDYSLITFSSLASINFSALSNNSYNQFPNGSDTSKINVQGYSKFGCITGLDLNNSAPSNRNEVAWQGVTNGDAHPEVLSVDYAAQGGGAILALM